MIDRTLVTPLSALLWTGDNATKPALSPTESPNKSVSHIVALRNNQLLTWNDFCKKVLSKHYIYNKISGDRVGIFCADSFDFATSFFALLYAKKTVVILPNTQPAFLSTIAPNIDSLITDSEISNPEITPILINSTTTAPSDATPGSDIYCNKLNPHANSIEFFTSGSTGSPKRVSKTLIQLEAEILELESLWGELIKPHGCAISTVTHQHIYGLLFRVLWPLSTKRPFDTILRMYPEDLKQQCKQYPSNFLVSSPAHLKRIPTLVNLSSIANSLSCIFSSGGALSKEVAITISNSLKRNVIEILGSTETGGVAHRSQSQTPDSAFWHPFPSVFVNTTLENKTLMVKSPFTGQNEFYPMGDTATLHNGGRSFELHGRNDSLVKIEEKRVSLIEIQNKLAQSELVNEATTIVLNGSRQFIAAIVVLSTKGNSVLALDGKVSVNKQLREFLATYFERVLLPRKWRYVAAIPSNPQGKTTKHELELLFKNPSNNHSTPTTPNIIGIEQRESEVIIKIHIPTNLRYFNGHFDSFPILPGVVQIDWAISLGQKHFKLPCNFERMEAIKFHKVIKPGDCLNLTLRCKNNSAKLHFAYESDSSKYSSGGLFFGESQ